ncbi:MAG: hypothetical protein IPH20_14445 [Bacteroidales bacterium]|nr:hypothetical protein [Bacteroidales bacterium]
MLIRDLLDAFESDSKEYFIQYITTKESKLDESNVLEVIDGQQIFKVLGDNWDKFIETYPDNNEQDIYYLYSAANYIYKTLNDTFENSKNYDAFALFVKENVKIILNDIKGNISCEKIFSNLNTNKVELTSSELIKVYFLQRLQGSIKELKSEITRRYLN